MGVRSSLFFFYVAQALCFLNFLLLIALSNFENGIVNYPTIIVGFSTSAFHSMKLNFIDFVDLLLSATHL